MAIPVHLWLKDEGGADIVGSSDVSGRVGSIEVLSLAHGVHTPADSNTGRLMGTRSHRPVTIEKEIDKSTPILYRAVAKGETLQAAELKFYRINEGGSEELYFEMKMKNVKVVSVSPRVPNIKEQAGAMRNHFEIIEFMYEEVQWLYLDGNIAFKDGWNIL